MSPPALIVAETAAQLSRSLAALPLADRLAMAAHRAGCSPIYVITPGPLPELPRCRAWGVALAVQPTLPKLDSEPVLVLGSHWLLQAADLRNLMELRGRLVSAKGESIPAGVIPSEALVAGPASLNAEALLSLLEPLPHVTARGVAERCLTDVDFEKATHALWASLTSSTDGYVDRVFNRPVGRRVFSRLLIHTPITPNQVSVASVLIGVAGAAFLATGRWGYGLIGAVLFQLSAVIDCVDGDLARILFKESPLGKWIDLVGDQVVHVSIFLGIAAGLWRSGTSAPAGILGAACVLGALISFGVILRNMRSPSATANERLQRWIDGATSRDFSVLVLVLAAMGRLEWFLWMAAIGSHVFWIAAASLQRRTVACT